MEKLSSFRFLWNSIGGRLQVMQILKTIKLLKCHCSPDFLNTFQLIFSTEIACTLSVDWRSIPRLSISVQQKVFYVKIWFHSKKVKLGFEFNWKASFYIQITKKKIIPWKWEKKLFFFIPKDFLTKTKNTLRLTDRFQV